VLPALFGFGLCRGFGRFWVLQRAQVLYLRLTLQFHFLLLRLRVFGVHPFRRHAGVGFPVGDGKLMAVAVATFDCHLRDGFTAGRHHATGFDK
jgi:uncharacterized membrane protein YedE/YeeE